MPAVSCPYRLLAVFVQMEDLMKAGGSESGIGYRLRSIYEEAQAKPNSAIAAQGPLFIVNLND